ncbi:MAG: hypothetical protein K5878_08985 [Rhizobiaceae bacterium]|nr:hypothetical protein [Rhizobiaceae bacterium]
MERYVVSLGFWAGFGRAMAVAVVLFAIAAMFGDDSFATFFSATAGLVVWAAFSLFFAIDGRNEARRRWNDYSQSRDGGGQ